MLKNMMLVGCLIAGAMLIVSGIGVPRQDKKLKRDDARTLAKILEICPPLPDNAAFSIPGYKSVQCFYKEEANGSKTLVEDLNSRVGLPKPVRMR